VITRRGFLASVTSALVASSPRRALAGPRRALASGAVAVRFPSGGFDMGLSMRCVEMA
jgi:hypothetical protein